MAARVPSDSLRSERTPSLVSQDTVAEKRDYNPEVWHLKFRSFSPSERSDPIQDLKRISELCSFWLRPDLHSKEEILDQLVLEQFMISARPELQALVKESGVKSCKELERLLRNGEKPRQWVSKWAQGKDSHGGYCDLNAEPTKALAFSQWPLRGEFCFLRGQVYLLRHPCAENAAATKIEWDDVNPEHLSGHEEPPNRGQARPELQNLLETEEPSTSQANV
ncbi:Zinc finger and SCAN domain-containing protein 5B [Lemmus lemmus]